jgi:hypothetical protein
MNGHFFAVHESAYSPEQTHRDVRSESVMRSKADVMRTLLNVCP